MLFTGDALAFVWWVVIVYHMCTTISRLKGDSKYTNKQTLTFYCIAFTSEYHQSVSMMAYSSSFSRLGFQPLLKSYITLIVSWMCQQFNSYKSLSDYSVRRRKVIFSTSRQPDIFNNYGKWIGINVFNFSLTYIVYVLANTNLNVVIQNKFFNSIFFKF